MTKPYAATIQGKRSNVIGIDAQQQLILEDGERYTFERLNFNPPGQPAVEPSGDILCWQLLEVAKVQQWHGDWKWNDEEKLVSNWMKSEFKKAGYKHPASSEYFKRAVAKARLNDLPSDIQDKVRGVAWFMDDKGSDDWNTPILLSQFRSLPPSEKADKTVSGYVTNIKAAAGYVGVTERTILNWKRRCWLKVEQVGKKIRIAKAELDKCKSGQ